MEHDRTPASSSAPATPGQDAARGGGGDVLDQLPALRRYALSLTRDPTDAEDLVHDALLRAWEKQGTFRAERGLRQWLLSILHNTFVDRLRTRRAERRRIEQIAGDLRADPAAHQLAPAQDHALRLAQVRQAFMALPEEQRAVLHLVTVEGLGYSEAAQALGVPVGTVMSRLARARAALRAYEERPAADITPETATVTHLRVVGGTDDTTD